MVTTDEYSASTHRNDDDDRVADALDEIDIDPVDLPDGFEERIRAVVHDEVDQKPHNREVIKQ